MRPNFGNFYPKLVMLPNFGNFLPKMGHATNSNCHRDQILVIFYQKLVTRPIPIVITTKFYNNFYQKLVARSILIVFRDQILVIFTKNWSHNQFQLSS